jgi:hypothetical protein
MFLRSRMRLGLAFASCVLATMVVTLWSTISFDMSGVQAATLVSHRLVEVVGHPYSDDTMIAGLAVACVVGAAIGACGAIGIGRSTGSRRASWLHGPGPAFAGRKGARYVASFMSSASSERDLELMIGAVARSIFLAAEEMEAAAREMSDLARRANQDSTALAIVTEQTVGTAQAAASAVDVLALSVNEIGGQVGRCARACLASVGEAIGASEVAGDLANAVSSASQITDQIDLLAAWSHLMALDASIEAIRAGEQDKSGPVSVANSMSLTRQTSLAVEEVVAQVSVIQAMTIQMIGAIETISARLGTVGEIATAAASSVADHEMATDDIAGRLRAASSGIQVIGATSSMVLNTVGAADLVAARVLRSAATLRQRAGDLSGTLCAFQDPSAPDGTVFRSTS